MWGRGSLYPACAMGITIIINNSRVANGHILLWIHFSTFAFDETLGNRVSPNILDNSVFVTSIALLRVIYQAVTSAVPPASHPGG